MKRALFKFRPMLKGEFSSYYTPVADTDDLVRQVSRLVIHPEVLVDGIQVIKNFEVQQSFYQNKEQIYTRLAV